MVIIMVLMLTVPALISMLLFERFKGYELTLLKRVSLFLIFAFLINMVGYAAFLMRGWDYINMTAGNESVMANTSFVVIYMGITLVSAVAIPFVLSLVRISKRPESGEGIGEESPSDEENLDNEECICEECPNEGESLSDGDNPDNDENPDEEKPFEDRPYDENLNEENPNDDNPYDGGTK
jgi:hypothetical protein